jgi:plasmid stabilization system protein ParE
MGYKVVYTEDAKKDIASAIEYAEERFGKLTADRLQSRIEAVEEVLEMFPYAAKVYDEELKVHTFSIPKYPFALYTRIDDDKLRVIAFAFESERRDPEAIRDLIKTRINTPGGAE